MSVLGQKKIELLSYLLHLSFFIRFSSNRMKNVTKKCKMVQYLYVNDLQYVNLCNTVNIHQSYVIIIYLSSVDKNVLHMKKLHLRFYIDI